MIDPCSGVVVFGWSDLRRNGVAQNLGEGIVVRDASGQVRDLFADRNAGDTQIATRAVVALHEHTDRVSPLIRR